MSKLAIVTGANKGIGFFITKRLCRELGKEWVVMLTARNVALGEAAVASLKAEGLSPVFHQLDIDNTDSINAFKEHISATYGGIDILVNNAGFAFKVAATEPFAEQAEVTVRINFFGTLNVCKALVPIVRPGGRVVNVSSTAGLLKILSPALQAKFVDPSLTLEGLVDLMSQFVDNAKSGRHTANGWPESAYGTSKVGVTQLSRILARDYGKNGILINACCPGWCRTDMAGARAPKSAEDGADTPVYLATVGADGPQGKFVRDRTVLDF
eukprot:Opistho-2@66623